MMLPSPYPRILGTNHVPSSEVERCKIRHHISDLERNLIIIDTKAAQISESSVPVYREREACRQSVEAHKMLLSPARRIPVEIISRVFLECLPVHGETNKSEPSAHTAPLLVSAICSGWRQIAISTPYLWNSIYLCFDDIARLINRGHVADGTIKRLDDPQRGTELDIEMMKLWISRAHTIPISIRLECSLGWRNTSTLTPKMVIDILRGVRISNLIMGIRLSVSNCVEMLSCCSQIIHCSFTRITLDSDMQILLRNPILLPYLQSLWLWTDCDISQLFHSLTLPGLTTLSVEYPNRLIDDLWPQSEFVSLNSRSVCRLQKLRLHQVTITSDALIACLTCVASITEASIRDGAQCLNDNVLAAMTFQPHEGIPLCPRLEVIRFNGHAYSDQAFVDMVESRWEYSKVLTSATSQVSLQVSCLKTVRVKMRTKNGDPWKRLQKFHGEGLDTMGPEVDVIPS